MASLEFGFVIEKIELRRTAGLEQEIIDIARKDITALSDYLGNKDYYLINKPTCLDVCVFAFLAEMIVPDLKCELNDIALSYENLVNFVHRMKNQFYPE